MANGIGNTASRFFTLPTSEAPFPLLGGASLPTFTLAYEIYGEMSDGKDNVILLFHALTGSQHAAGFCESVPGLHVEWTPDCQQGWWDGFIGPGAALDTSRHCVICVNYLGGCYGSTGPSSINPETGRPFGSAFPRIAVADIVDSQMKLLDHLGVGVLHAAIGGSLGGMLCISLATRYPERVRNVIPIASGLVPSPLQRLHNFEQIYAIETDRHFQGGDYYDGDAPLDGLALARMISHKTFVSLETMERRARDEVKPPKNELFSWYLVRRSLESYMLHQGTKFVRRFDANSYLRIVDAWQHFNPLVEAAASSFTELFRPCVDQRYLVFTVDSDVCFYPDHQTELDNALKDAGVSSMRITVHSDKGHDAFLLEPELFTPHLAYMLMTAPPFDPSALARDVAGLAARNLLVGTSSWKYPGWAGQIYDEQRYLWRGKFSESRFDRHCLDEYATVFKTVCVDAGYYRFPTPEFLARLAAQVPDDFRFSFKVTDEITVREFPRLPRFGTRGGQANPHFLDAGLFSAAFLEPCEHIRDKVGLLIFEFSHFHKGTFERGRDFVAALDTFLDQLPSGWQYGVEIRNRAFLHPEYFAMLADHGVTHIFNNWTRMPPVGEQLALEGSRATDFFGARFLLTPGRSYAEAVEDFSPYAETKREDPEAREAGAALLAKPTPRRSYLYVNNRLEGNAIQTIRAMIARLKARKDAIRPSE